MGFKRLVFLSLLPFTVNADIPSMQPGRDFAFEGNSDITINNRILLKVNGKPISVFDVVKKMDLLFFRQYPELVSSKLARYQYYQASWRPVLASVIDDQLIIADADEKKVEITEGDIREEMEDLFGPDVVITIDNLGMTYDEAWELLKNELKVRRMNGMMVRSKALNEVSPKAIREQYDEYVKAHPPSEIWTYAMITLRGEEEEVSVLAEEVYQRLTLEKWRPQDVVELMKERAQITLSEDYNRATTELSESHKTILQSLPDGGISVPIFQKGRKGSEFLARLFLLKTHGDQQVPSFDSMKAQIQQELTQKAVLRNSKLYLEKLRTHYGITEAYLADRIPDTFQPFTLR